jgi:integrase
VLSPRNRAPYAPKTLRGYRQAFRDWITPELGAQRVDQLSRDAVQWFVDAVAAQRSAATTRNTAHALCALYTHLLPRHAQLADPTHGLILPRAPEPRQRYADVPEIDALLSALPHELATPYALAFLAGLRHGEIQALPLDCIDLEAGWLDVRFSLDRVAGFKGPKSGAGERPVPIFDGLRPYLTRQVAEVRAIVGTIAASTDDRPGTLLLPSARASRWGAQTFGTPFKEACCEHWTRAGLASIGLHEARHSFATALVRAGYDVKTISEWIGHAQASTTLNVYAKRRGRLEAAEMVAGRMNRYLAAAAG